MHGLMHFLAQNPYIPFFLIVGLAVWVGKFSIKGYGLGMVAAAIIVGCGILVLGSTHGEKFELNNFAIGFHFFKINPAALMGGIGPG